MPAYVVLILEEVHGLGWLAEYQANVPSLVQAHGGEYVAMSKGFDGQGVHRVEGRTVEPAAIGLIRFPSMEDLVNFFKSAAYQPYRQMRIAETCSTAFAFEA